MSLLEPLVPLTEIDELVLHSVEPVLIDNLVNCASESFRISVW